MSWLYNPILKSIFSVLSVFISGVLCSALITDITVEGKLNWSLLTSRKTFYVILVFVAVSILYSILTAKEELHYRKKINTSFLKKFIEEKGLDEFAEEVSDAIRKGNKKKLSNLIDMKEMLTANLEKK